MDYRTKEPSSAFDVNIPTQLRIKRTNSRSWEIQPPEHTSNTHSSVDILTESPLNNKKPETNTTSITDYSIIIGKQNTETVLTSSVSTETVPTKSKLTKSVPTESGRTESVSTYQVSAKLVRTNSVLTDSVSEGFNAYQPDSITSCYTRLPHEIYEALTHEDLSLRQFKIMLVILRETIGWSYRYVQMNYQQLAAKTGVAQSHLGEELKKLRKKQILVIIQDPARGCNSYALNETFFLKYRSTDSVSTKEGGIISTDSVLTDKHQFGASTELGNSAKLQMNSTENQELNIVLKKDLNKSLSLCSETLTNLISKLMKKERERALTLLKELNTETQPDLELVFNDVFQNRKDTSGKEIKSEIGYLETCYLKHRDWLKATESENNSKKHKQSENDAVRQAKEQKERSEQEEWEKIKQAFLEAFPTEEEQNKVIENYAKTMTGLSLSIGPARKSLAISAWFRDNYGRA